MSEEMEVYPYQRVKSAGKKKRPVRKKKRLSAGRFRFSGRLLKELTWDAKMPLLCAAGFFLGRVILLGEMVPCAAAFAAAVARVYPGAGLPAVAGACVGLATVSRGLPLAGALATVVLTWALARGLPGETGRPWLIMPLLVLSLTLIVKTGLLAFTGPATYEYIGVAFEALIAAALTLVFLQALPVLDRLSGAKPPSGEELFSFSVLLAALVAGTGELQIGLFTLKGLLSRLIILLAALAGGPGLGAAAGAVVGILPGLVYTAAPAVVGAFSFTGLLAGLGRGFGKAGVAVGFLLGNIILSVYLDNFGGLAKVAAETGLAVLLFLLVPPAHVNRLAVSLVPAVDPAPAAVKDRRVQAVVAGRMRHWSRVLHELSRSFDQVASTAPAPGGVPEAGLQPLFNEIGGKVCRGCGMYRTCWEREFYQTYQALLELFSLVETYGQVNSRDLPEVLKKRCSRPKEMAITVTCLYDTYKVNQYWAGRLSESKEVVSNQLRGVSEIIENLSHELEFDVAGTGREEALLRQKLKQAGIPVADVRVSRPDGERQEVMLCRQACPENGECQNRVVPLVSRLLDGRYTLPVNDCALFRGEEGICRLRLYPDLPLRLVAGVASRGKDGVCGDSYALLPLRGGKFAVVLSDGMGVGAPAAAESRTAVSLLARLLESGLEHHLAVKTVNSIMVLRATGDSFATLDVALLDLYTGAGEFIKIGAPACFLVRNHRVSTLQASSLPVGIIKDIDVASVDKKLQPGDTLVMVSDGVLDAHRGPEDKEDWLCGVLREIGDLAPREMAELLLKLAQTGAGGEKQGDDMTVLVVRLEKAV
ncbi:stage II sporulation protein E [Desulfotomaculum copahuensis]|uniref:Stage II sporulation protein E n=1 Tax=Desulfotomaculum copahuensis TaxID=1838280 RepID=A0A1B7LCN1_9FIRM|nr:stage II sporulation protein E [Desulfotomaculum copahuensis]OAT80685.1 stage II sporulation protein E [Desulfotomaculum copahuensis]